MAHGLAHSDIDDVPLTNVQHTHAVLGRSPHDLSCVLEVCGVVGRTVLNNACDTALARLDSTHSTFVQHVKRTLS